MQQWLSLPTQWSTWVPQALQRRWMQWQQARQQEGSPQMQGQGFKPCHVHEKGAQNLYSKCRKNPCNQKTSSKASTNNDNKRRHSSHYQDNRYTSSNSKSRRSDNAPMPSKGKTRVSSRSKKEENHHLSYDAKIPPKWRKVDVPTCSQQNKNAELIWDGMTR